MRGCEPIGREILATFARACAGVDAGSRKRPKLAFPLSLAGSLILHLSGQAQLDVQDTKHPENAWWVRARCNPENQTRLSCMRPHIKKP